jgi:DNA-binding response OmpR family regulator
MKIVVADDEALSRMVLKGVLGNAGYDVVMTTDGDEALAALSAPDAPQLAVLDWMMPGKNGLDICRALRAQAGRRYTYVVMLTAKDRREERLEAISAGADDFLSKPIDQAELLARLRTGQRILRAEGALAEKVLELEQALHQVKHLEGIITICMHCRRIASGKDEWQKLEAYIEAHSNASFTHGLCHDCLDKHFPEGGPSEAPAD